MQKYYRYSASERFKLLKDCEEDYTKSDFYKFLRKEVEIEGPIAELWRPFPIKFVESKKKISDFPFLDTTFLAISEKGLDCLRDLINPYVEVLPLNIVNSDLKYYGLHVTKLYDADLSRSDYYGNPERNYVSHIDVHAFPEDILPEAPIFRVRQTKNIRVFISEAFRKVAEENRLIGLNLHEEMKYRTGPAEGTVL